MDSFFNFDEESDTVFITKTSSYERAAEPLKEILEERFENEVEVKIESKRALSSPTKMEHKVIVKYSKEGMSHTEKTITKSIIYSYMEGYLEGWFKGVLSKD